MDQNQKKLARDARARLNNLLKSVGSIGRDRSDVLIRLCEIAVPDIEPDRLGEALKLMFEKIPSILRDADDEQFRNIVVNSRSHLSMRMLLSFRELVKLLERFSNMHLLALTCSASPLANQHTKIVTRLQYLQGIQQIFVKWGPKDTLKIATELKKAPATHRASVLFRYTQHVSRPLVPILHEILKLSEAQLRYICDLYRTLDSVSLAKIANLLVMECSLLLQIKERLGCQPVVNQDTPHGYSSGTVTGTLPQGAHSYSSLHPAEPTTISSDGMQPSASGTPSLDPSSSLSLHQPLPTSTLDEGDALAYSASTGVSRFGDGLFSLHSLRESDGLTMGGLVSDIRQSGFHQETDHSLGGVGLDPSSSMFDKQLGLDAATNDILPSLTSIGEPLALPDLNFFDDSELVDHVMTQESQKPEYPLLGESLAENDEILNAMAFGNSIFTPSRTPSVAARSSDELDFSGLPSAAADNPKEVHSPMDYSETDSPSSDATYSDARHGNTSSAFAQSSGDHSASTMLPTKTEPNHTPIPAEVSSNSSAASVMGSTLSSSSQGNYYVQRGKSLTLKLVMARQPPPKTVYQRILRPFPSVMIDVLDGPSTPPDLADFNLFVEVSLVRSDTEVSEPRFLEGNRVTRLGGGSFATFTKLKILSTSQQQGTHFRLLFRLKRYNGTAFVNMPGAEVLSAPVEVFSHTLYLNNRTGKRKSNDPPPPHVSEILPDHGAVDTKVVVLGAGFLKSNRLRVRFGDSAVPARFHSNGTLICKTPPCSSAGAVIVSVANDGRSYCRSTVSYNYQ